NPSNLLNLCIIINSETMRKILIPTDFSANAMNAIKYALELFKYEIGQFYIMHAYESEIYDNEALENREDLDVIAKNVYEQSLHKLEKVLQEIQEISPNPRHEYHIISSKNLLVEGAS